MRTAVFCTIGLVGSWGDAGAGQLVEGGALSRPAVKLQTTDVDEPAASDATLSGLTVSHGTLSLPLRPSFGSGTTSYTARLAHEVQTITVTPTASDANATVSITPDDADTGTTGHQVDLVVGDIEITVTVTAEDGATTQTYTVTVARDEAALVQTNWSLKPEGLGVGDQFRLLFVTSTNRAVDWVSLANVTLADRVWAAAGRGHAAIWAYASMFRALASTPQVDARDNTATTGTGVAIYWLNGERIADNYADFYDGTWASTSARDEFGEFPTNLSSHQHVWTGSASNGTEKRYWGSDLDSLSVALGARGGWSWRGCLYGNRPLDCGASSKGAELPLYGLSPVFAVVVSTDATLSSLTLGGVRLDPAFAPSTRSYTASVTNVVSSTTVKPTTTYDRATVSFDPADADSNAEGHQVDLAVGATRIGVSVTAEDGTTTLDYAVTLTRGVPLEAQEVPVDWSLIPAGLGGGDRFRLLFVGRPGIRGWDDVIGDYDSMVQRDAESGHAAIWAYASMFRALASTPLVDARDNTATTGTGVAIYWLNGEKIADDYADFYDGNWESTLARDKDGEELSHTYNPWTGTATNGTEKKDAGISFALGAPKGDSKYGASTYGCPGDPDAALDCGTQVQTAIGSIYGLSPVFTVSDSTDATLRGLTLSDGTLTQKFASGNTTYTVDVANSVASVTVTPTTSADGAQVSIDPVDADHTTPGHQVTLDVGGTEITVTVTAEDGTTRQEYKVTVTRAAVPQVTVSFGSSAYSVVEGDTVTVTLTLSADPERSASVPLTATNHGGASNADYSGVPASVSFASGETSKSFTLTATDDAVDDDGESVDLGFGTLPTGVTAGSVASTTVSITSGGQAATDFNGDGRTDFLDLFLFVDAFGGTDARFDLDGSGTVDFVDFFQFIDAFDPPERARLVAVAQKMIGLSRETLLQQNTPNPLNSETVISWFLLKPGATRVEVFSVTGQRLVVLHEGLQQAGYHRVHWDGRDAAGHPLASGVYLYQLVSAEGVLTRKLTLLR